MRFCSKAFLAPVALLAITVPARAGIYTLTMTPSAAQTMRYDRGISSIDSVQKATVVRVVNVPGNDKKSVSFVIGIANAAGQTFNFGPENITIRPSGMKPIALTTYEEALGQIAAARHGVVVMTAENRAPIRSLPAALGPILGPVVGGYATVNYGAL